MKKLIYLIMSLAVVSAASCAKNNDPVPVTGVSLDKPTLTLTMGGTETGTLVATVAPADAANKSVQWSSDDESVATVDQNGKVTAVDVGEATITVETVDGGFTDECAVTVSAAPAAVTGVTLNKQILTLTFSVTETETLVATVAPADAADKAVTWSSGDTGVATVDGNGKVSAVAVGKAVITVTTVNGGFTDECAVTVMPVPVADILPFITDEAFKAHCLDRMVNTQDITDENSNPITLPVWDTDGNGKLSSAEAAAVTHMNSSAGWNGMGYFHSTDGIEYFTGLVYLYLSGHNSVTSVDLSQNRALTYLEILSSPLGSVDVSMLKKLTHLGLYGCSLTSLDVRSNTALTYLDYSNNTLSSVDVSHNTELTYLACENAGSTGLDLSANTKLVGLNCNRNELGGLDLSGNPLLANLNCNLNELSGLDLSGNPLLANLNCYDNRLSSLDLSHNSRLSTLSCGNNLLTRLNLSNNPELIVLLCQNNSLTEIDISAHNGLMHFFDCSGNPDLATVWVWPSFNLADPASNFVTYRNDTSAQFKKKPGLIRKRDGEKRGIFE